MSMDNLSTQCRRVPPAPQAADSGGRRSVTTHLAALALAVAGLAAPPAAAEPESRPPDLRVEANIQSLGRNRTKGATESTRRLAITVENRERSAVKNLELRWRIVARDVNSRKLSIAANGRQPLTIGPEETAEVTSGPARFIEREGKTKTTGKGKNRRQTTGPDTGTDYAGYVVEVYQHGKLVAEASTAGMRERTKGMK